MVESKKTQALLLAVLVVFALFMLRAVMVGCYHWSLCDAIYVYQLNCRRIDREPEVWQEDKERFSDTYRRWWDWSDHHILPEEKDRMVRPYIGEEVEEWERLTR